MKLNELARKRVLILGLGREGLETYRFLRAEFPHQVLGLADRLPPERLAPEVQAATAGDGAIVKHLGDGYLTSINNYDVIIRSPGVALLTPALQQAARAGARITSHIEIFLANCTGITVGVTGTKGKSTTASLIHAILRAGGLDAHLVGNIGAPPLNLLRTTVADTYLVMELSSYQLDGISRSPHIAVLLNIVPEHLDLHGGFENYVSAKQNITRFQTGSDILIYNAAHPIPRDIAGSSRARRLGFALEESPPASSFLQSGDIVFRGVQGSEVIMAANDVSLPGRFNLQNVLAAVTVGRVLGVDRDAVALAIRTFKPLPYRLEPIGSYRGIEFYNDPLATIPEATIAALDALGDRVATVILGGFDRGTDMDGLANRLRRSRISTVILFPPSGTRIWQAIEREYRDGAALPKWFVTTSMREAVSLAFRHTPGGMISLHSPASPSFGLFKDYVERGNLFSHYVREMGCGA